MSFFFLTFKEMLNIGNIHYFYVLSSTPSYGKQRFRTPA